MVQAICAVISIENYYCLRIGLLSENYLLKEDQFEDKRVLGILVDDPVFYPPFATHMGIKTGGR